MASHTHGNKVDPLMQLSGVAEGAISLHYITLHTPPNKEWEPH
jgi:hypothetical protein